MIQAKPGDVGVAGVREEVERMRNSARKMSRNSIDGPSGYQDFKADAQPSPWCGHLS